MLVRGHRIENIEEAKSVRVVADAQQFEPILVAPVVASPILLLLFLFMMIRSHIIKRHKKKTGK